MTALYAAIAALVHELKARTMAGQEKGNLEQRNNFILVVRACNLSEATVIIAQLNRTMLASRKQAVPRKKKKKSKYLT